MYNNSGTLMNRELIAYSGKEFTIEWYFDSRGKSSALDYYASLTAQERIRVLQLFKRMGDAGEIKDTTKFNYEGDHVYAFKPKPDRFLCFFYVGKKIIVTNAFRKKQPKLPDNEKSRAMKHKKDYEARMKQGEYYD
jgi:phage-related protein